MSLVPVNLVINFTADFAGQHRACYRLVGSTGPYTCVNTTCIIGACVANIPVFVDNETCATVQYEGYVQPACQDVNSSEGRVPWTYSFVPAPSCRNYVVTCANQGVASVVIVSSASGYNISAPPAVLFTGGGGSGATGTAVVGAGQILSISINTAGTGYADGTYTNVSLTGGTGTGAKATVVINGGIVRSMAITTAGTGYLSTDVLGITNATGGTVANFHITSDSGKVISITITNAGLGYTSAPDVTIAPSSFGGSVGTAVLLTCPSFTDYGCSGSSINIPQGALPVGSSMSVCSKTGAPVVSNNYSVVPTGNCLCSCTLTTIGVSGPVGTSVRYFYNSCGGAVVTGILTVGGSPSSLITCAVTGSVVFQTLTPGTIGTISLGGAC